VRELYGGVLGLLVHPAVQPADLEHVLAIDQLSHHSNPNTTSVTLTHRV
jgi:hypothetical protein